MSKQSPNEAYLFYRIWPGFNDSFPFDQFNGLSDQDLDDALDNLAAEWVSRNGDVLNEGVKRTEEKLGETVRRRQSQFTIPPSGRTKHKPRRRHSVESQTRLIQIIGRYAGWTHGAYPIYLPQVVGPRVWICEDKRDLVELAVAEFNRQGRRDAAGFLLRFDYADAADLAESEMAVAELSIRDIADVIARRESDAVREFLEALKAVRAKSASRSETTDEADADGFTAARKRPPDKAFRASFIRDMLGESKQTDIANTMTQQGIPANQGQVSKWLKAVDKYRTAGGIIPTLDELTRPQAIDPKVIEMGARQDGLTPRQRPRRDSDADSGDE